MIDFYTYGTFNGKAVAIALEEMAVEYQMYSVDLMQAEQRSESFLALNPSGRIPVIVDRSTEPATTITQTGAILIYLAEKTGLLLPQQPREKAKVLEWLMFQLTDISCNVFNNFYLKSLVSPNHPAAGEVLKQRAIKFYQIFEQQLSTSRYLVGEQLSIADVVTFPVVDALKDHLIIHTNPALMKWYQTLSQKQSFVKGLNHAA